MALQTQINRPAPNAPVVDPETGGLTKAWWYVINTLVGRTGGAAGVDVTVIQAQADQANNIAIYGLMDDDDVATTAITNVAALTTIVANQGVQIALSDEPEPVAPSMMWLAYQDSPEPAPPLSQAVFLALALTNEAN